MPSTYVVPTKINFMKNAKDVYKTQSSRKNSSFLGVAPRICAKSMSLVHSNVCNKCAAAQANACTLLFSENASAHVMQYFNRTSVYFDVNELVYQDQNLYDQVCQKILCKNERSWRFTPIATRFYKNNDGRLFIFMCEFVDDDNARRFSTYTVLPGVWYNFEIFRDFSVPFDGMYHFMLGYASTGFILMPIYAFCTGITENGAQACRQCSYYGTKKRAVYNCKFCGSMCLVSFFFKKMVFCFFSSLVQIQRVFSTDAKDVFFRLILPGLLLPTPCIRA